MVVYFFQEHFIRNAIVQIFAGVYFVAKVNPAFVECIQYRQPAVGQFCKSCFNKACGSLRPGVHGVPEQCAAKCSMCI